MPQYTFQCERCGRTFSRMLGFDDPRPDRCILCGGKAHRKYDAPNVLYRGSGFYSTDKALYEKEMEDP